MSDTGLLVVFAILCLIGLAFMVVPLLYLFFRAKPSEMSRKLTVLETALGSPMKKTDRTFYWIFYWLFFFLGIISFVYKYISIQKDSPIQVDVQVK